MNSILTSLGRSLAKFLSQPVKGYSPAATCDRYCFAAVLKPGDIILVEGKTRVSIAIKYLTQSTWSHAALYVGPILGRNEPDGEAHVLVEVDILKGVISAPLSGYFTHHTRICRPIGLAGPDIEALAAFVMRRLGNRYDLRNIFDLMRYLLPTPPVPVRFRRRMIALGSGEPTQAICSTLIAQAFQSINYPILPEISVSDTKDAAGNQTAREILHIRHHSLFTPRDFDISPYFEVIKPTLEMGFDYHKLKWAPL